MWTVLPLTIGTNTSRCFQTERTLLKCPIRARNRTDNCPAPFVRDWRLAQVLLIERSSAGRLSGHATTHRLLLARPGRTRDSAHGHATRNAAPVQVHRDERLDLVCIHATDRFIIEMARQLTKPA